MDPRKWHSLLVFECPLLVHRPPADPDLRLPSARQAANANAEEVQRNRIFRRSLNHRRLLHVHLSLLPRLATKVRLGHARDGVHGASGVGEKWIRQGHIEL